MWVLTPTQSPRMPGQDPSSCRQLSTFSRIGDQMAVIVESPKIWGGVFVFKFWGLKVDGTSFSDAESLVTTAHLTREICPRDLKYRKSKTNMPLWGHKNYYLPGVFSLSVRDWIKTKVVLWASVVKQFSMR